MSAPTQAVVRVKVARNVFTSPLMPLDEAKEAADTFRRAVVECGDGWWFVKFAGFDGREVQIRAREVVVIEYVPDLPDRVRPSSGAGSGARVDGLNVNVTAASDGTTFLRQLAGVMRDELARSEVRS